LNSTTLTPTTRFQPFDLLATLVAVARIDGTVVYANPALEDALGISRRSIENSAATEYFAEPQVLQSALAGAQANEFAALRYDTWLKRPGRDLMLVHLILAQTDQPGEVLIEMLPLEQQVRSARSVCWIRLRPTKN